MKSKKNILLVEPKIGYQDIKEPYCVITNFPVTRISNYSKEYYGLDRYKKAYKVLKRASKEFNIENTLDLLYVVRQERKWATRITFAYSQKENTVYYYSNNKRSDAQVYRF